MDKYVLISLLLEIVGDWVCVERRILADFTTNCSSA